MSIFWGYLSCFLEWINKNINGFCGWILMNIHHLFKCLIKNIIVLSLKNIFRDQYNASKFSEKANTEIFSFR